MASDPYSLRRTSSMAEVGSEDPRSPMASKPRRSVSLSSLTQGEQVRITHLRNRPWLNGLQGQVLDPRMDERGFVMVHLPQYATDQEPSRMVKKVHVECLESVDGGAYAGHG